jgi:hypothetical protein
MIHLRTGLTVMLPDATLVWGVWPADSLLDTEQAMNVLCIAKNLPKQ